MIVLPESGPTRSFHCSASAKPVLASLQVGRMPRISVPTPTARMAAAAGPEGGSASVTSGARSVCSIVVIASLLFDWGALRDKRPVKASDTFCDERSHEDRHHDESEIPITRQHCAVVDRQKRRRCRQHRGNPRDVLLPFHSKLVPVGGVRIRQQLRLGTVRRFLSVPGIDDPCPRDDRQPCHDRHRRYADLEPSDALAKSFGRQVVRAEAVEPSQPAAEREKEQSAEDHPVDERPPLPLGEMHACPPFLGQRMLSRPLLSCPWPNCRSAGERLTSYNSDLATEARRLAPGHRSRTASRRRGASCPRQAGSCRRRSSSVPPCAVWAGRGGS